MATVANKTMTRCYLTAPANLPLGALFTLLEQRGVVVTHDGENSSAGINESDFIIAIIGPPGTNQNVFFNLGYASALKKRCLLVLPHTAESIPQRLRGLPQVTAELDDRDPIAFALDLVRAAPRHTNAAIGTSDTTFPIGQERSLQLLAQLTNNVKGSDLEEIIATALKQSGITIVEQSYENSQDTRFDLAAWSDELDSIVGNPLLMEVKRDLRQRAQLRMAQQQVALYLADTHARTALLLYFLGPTEEEEFVALSTPNVLLLPITEFLTRLGEQSFSAIIRDLRNRVAHRAAA